MSFTLVTLFILYLFLAFCFLFLDDRYKKNKRWNQSVALSKEDRMYKDAIDTAAESQDSDIAEELLRFFVSVGVSFAPMPHISPLFCCLSIAI